MREDEINKAIAEKCGWTSIGPSGRLDGQLTGYPAKNPIIGHPQEIPDFVNDLNAMRLAESTLTPESSGQYRIELEDAHGHLHYGPCDLLYWFEQVHSSAQKRAEAFLKTYGKWKE